MNTNEKSAGAVDVLVHLKAARTELCAALKRDDITYEQIDSFPAVRRLDATSAAVDDLIKFTSEAVREFEYLANRRDLPAQDRERWTALARVGVRSERPPKLPGRAACQR